MKKKIVLFGAYDRYNFGDNLMPILLEMYIAKYHPDKANEYEFIHASISESDLSIYSCLKTKSISSVIEELKSGDTIIVVGGEVLCASNTGLFLHMPKPKLLNDIFTKLNSLPVIKKVFKKWVDPIYSTPWDYPYLPDPLMLPSGVEVKYNTIGGGISRRLPAADKVNLTARLENAKYISVRDNRTLKRLSGIKNIKLYPDSAFIMSDLCTDSFLKANVRNDILNYVEQSYVIFQAAPKKLGTSLSDITKKLASLSSSIDKKILLLPIGYAAGHDDFHLLNEIYKNIPDCSDIKFDLNVWEIMYLIKHSDFYMGTSLHGAITAMSFGKPHFGINKSIGKLDSFLKDWSIPPYDHCYEVSDIDQFYNIIRNEQLVELDANVKKIISLVIENNKKLFSFHCTKELK